MDTKTLGKKGEELACEYLVEKGYKILGRNWQIPFGELDIIARRRLTPLNKIFQILASAYKPKLFNWVKGLTVDKLCNSLLISTDKTIHFVEVKTLGSSFANIYPEQHVDERKKQKLRQLAQIWLTKHQYRQNHPYKIDIIAITFNEEKTVFRHFENAVQDI